MTWKLQRKQKWRHRMSTHACTPARTRRCRIPAFWYLECCSFPVKLSWTFRSGNAQNAKPATMATCYSSIYVHIQQPSHFSTNLTASDLQKFFFFLTKHCLWIKAPFVRYYSPLFHCVLYSSASYSNELILTIHWQRCGRASFSGHASYCRCGVNLPFSTGEFMLFKHPLSAR